MAPYPDGGPLYIVSTPYMYLLYEFPPKELSTCCCRRWSLYPVSSVIIYCRLEISAPLLSPLQLCRTDGSCYNISSYVSKDRFSPQQSFSLWIMESPKHFKNFASAVIILFHIQYFIWCRLNNIRGKGFAVCVCGLIVKRFPLHLPLQEGNHKPPSLVCFYHHHPFPDIGSGGPIFLVINFSPFFISKKGFWVRV